MLRTSLIKLILTVIIAVVGLRFLIILLSSTNIRRPPVQSVEYQGKPKTFTRNGLIYPNGMLHLDSSLPKPNVVRANGAFIVLARNTDLPRLKRTIREVEARFNNRYDYPYIFLNQDEFSDEFKQQLQALTRAECKFGLIEPKNWGYPHNLDKAKVVQARGKLKDIIHGDEVNWRHMARFYSGFFMNHTLVQPYDYDWRLEAGVSYPCDLDYDPFMFMQVNEKVFSFVISLREHMSTVNGLWNVVKWFFHEHPGYLQEPNADKWLSDDEGVTYNGCHFLSNFELGDLRFFRSKAYQHLFHEIDKAGGIYYERWGDAPIHSIAAAFLLKPSEIHFFDDIGYYHDPTWHCPQDKELLLRCSCDPKDNVDSRSHSCTKQWKKLFH